VNRLVWFAAGAGVSVYAMAKARRAAQALTPEGLADRLAGLSLGIHLFGDEVRAGMAEKENELRGRLGLALPGSSTPTTPELPGPAPVDPTGTSTDDPTGNPTMNREATH